MYSGVMSTQEATSPLCPSPEDVERGQRELVARYMVTGQGRGKVLTAMATTLRTMVEFHPHRPRPESLAGLVAKVDAVLERCTGGEDYDRVAVSGVMSDAKVMVEGVELRAGDAEYVEWLRAGCPV